MERSLFTTHHIREESSQTIVIEWKLHHDLQAQGFPIFIVEDLTNEIKEEFIAGNAKPSIIQEFHVPSVFMPGDTYKITSKVMKSRYSRGLEQWFLGVEEVGRISNTFAKSTDEFTLSKMSDRATEFMLSKCEQNIAGDVNFFTRSKSKQYFDDVFQNQDGMMFPAIRENFGNPGCPINGRLAGLSFAANNFSFEKPLAGGDMKLYLPSNVMFNEHANLYFADFYTADIVPYVTLVLTTKDSQADAFARKHLCPLDPEENAYLIYRKKDDKTRVLVTGNILLFVYYTEPINLHNVKSYGGMLTTAPP